MKVMSHRGAKGLAPENTLAGFKKALKYKVDEIEFDLRLTRDGVVAVHHDPYITDPAGNKHVIEDHSYTQLLEYKPDMPTFEQVLDVIDHKVRMFVEVKPNEPTEKIIKTIKAYLKKGWKNSDFILGSFSQSVLLELQAALPDIEKAVIEKWSGVRASHRARQLGTKRVCMNQRWLWFGFIRAVARNGYQLYAYTVNNPRQAEKWAKYGLAGIVTDYPDRFQK